MNIEGLGAVNVVEGAGGEAAIISDINMIPVNGIELLRAIRSGRDGLKANTPVLMLTVHDEPELAAEAEALGANAFVLKPNGREDLIERIFHVSDPTATAG